VTCVCRTADRLASLETISIKSSSTLNPSLASPTDTIILTFSVAGESIVNTPTVLFVNGNDPKSPTALTSLNNAGRHWTASIAASALPEGLIAFTISAYTDQLGNTGQPRSSTTDGSSVTYGI